MAETQITEQIVKENPQIEAYRLSLLKAAQDLTKNPTNVPAYQVAGLSPFETQAMQFAQQGLGSYQPYLTTGTDALAGSANAYSNISPIASEIAQTGMGTMAGINPYINQFNNIGQSAVGVGNQYGGMMTNTANQTAGQANAYGTGMAALGGAGQGQMSGYGSAMAGYGVAGGEAVNPYAAGMAGMGVSAAQNVPGMYDTAITQQFMNPYQEAVTDQTLADIRRQAMIDMNALRARSVASGSYGGTRAAIGEQEFQRNVTDTMARTIANDRSQNYLQAQQAGMSAFEADRQRRLAGAQLGIGALQGAGNLRLAGSQLGLQGMQAGANASLAGLQFGMQGLQGAGGMALDAGQQRLAAAQGAGNLGMQGQQLAMSGAQSGAASYLDAQRTGLGALQTSGQMYGSLGDAYSNLGMQYGNMGALGAQLGQEQSRYLALLGGVQRENAQAALDASRNTQLAQIYEPYNRLGFLSDVYAKTPTSQSTITQSTAPSASPTAAALGSGIQAYAMYQGLNNLWNK